ncbi:hypothetical protein [Deinococcus sp. Marseille-Q6407]|uniref:hypothetical protein n=1 Tax=Deinococcus sp. Marseille-Q6407 TaxID=2969223 RepID=UPI0021C19421|nr:hypothetical protein [Deinococcus sp. Marseille-Q6407]
MVSVHSHSLPGGQTVYLTGLEHAAGAAALLARLTSNAAALLTGEVHAALASQDAGAQLLHLDLLEPPQQRSEQDAAGHLTSLMLSFPLAVKLYDSQGGRWVLDVNLVLTASDYAGGKDYALQTDFMVNAAVQLEG